MRHVFAISVAIAVSVATTSIGGIGSVHAQDQAQVDLQSALQTAQQAAQQQQQQAYQQQQQQIQQQFYQSQLGASGVQPYCNYYGTCAPPTAAAINAWRKILPGVYDQILPLYGIRDTDPTPDTVHPTVRHHHRVKGSRDARYVPEY